MWRSGNKRKHCAYREWILGSQPTKTNRSLSFSLVTELPFKLCSKDRDRILFKIRILALYPLAHSTAKNISKLQERRYVEEKFAAITMPVDYGPLESSKFISETYSCTYFPNSVIGDVDILQKVNRTLQYPTAPAGSTIDKNSEKFLSIHKTLWSAVAQSGRRKLHHYLHPVSLDWVWVPPKPTKLSIYLLGSVKELS